MFGTSDTLRVTLARVFLCCWACQVLKVAPFLWSFSCPVLTCGEREAVKMAPTHVNDSVVSPWLSFTSISYWDLLPQVLLGHPPIAIAADFALGFLSNLYASGVFLMHLWRERYSTSTYFSVILYLPHSLLMVSPESAFFTFLVQKYSAQVLL